MGMTPLSAHPKAGSKGQRGSEAHTGAGAKTFAHGYVFGAPLKDLGLIASLIMVVATGMIGFFLATFAGIVAVLFWTSTGHAADYTISYRLMGLPCGILLALLAFGYLGTFWVQRIYRSSTARAQL